MLDQRCSRFRKISKARLQAVIALLLTVSVVSVAHADEDKVAWVGGNYGLSVPSESNTSSRSAWGINGGAKVGSTLGVGAYYLTSHKDESINGTTQPWNYDLFGVMGGYFFEGEAKGVSLGVMLGTSKVGSSASGYTFQTSPFHYGVFVGYDYMVADHLSLGGNINYLNVVSSSSTVTTSSGASIAANTDSFGMLNFLLALKFWF